MNWLRDSICNMKTFIFTSVYASSLALFIFLQPSEHDIPSEGFNLIAYTKKSCFHIHHWSYMTLEALLLSFFIWFNNGSFNYISVAFIAFLLGGATSDVNYDDFFIFRIPCLSLDQLKSNISLIQTKPFGEI